MILQYVIERQSMALKNTFRVGNHGNVGMLWDLIHTNTSTCVYDHQIHLVPASTAEKLIHGKARHGTRAKMR